MQIVGPRPSDRNSYLCKGHSHCVSAEIEKQKALNVFVFNARLL